MEQPTDMFSMYLKFTPVILAVIFWIYCLSSKYSLSRMETMRQLKRWYDFDLDPPFPDSFCILS